MSHNDDEHSFAMPMQMRGLEKMAVETMSGLVENSVGLVSQLRKNGISDERVLGAIADVPRERFVDASLAADAYRDEPLPIGCGQTISAPFIVAYMSEKLDVRPDHDVLEVGTGSGYQAAILARLARHVYTIERHGALLDRARGIFRDLDIDNITTAQGDGSAGWAEPITFDRIMVTARARKMPEALIDQLKDGGKMILPLGRWPWKEKLVLVTKTQDDLHQEDLLPVRFVPLISG